MSQRAKGAGYELQARRYLERAGLTFFAANVTLRGGELDLIMRDGQTWVFVEVRYRRSDAFGKCSAKPTFIDPSSNRCIFRHPVNKFPT